MAKLEELEEVDLSGNMLKTIPTTVMNCRRMHTLIAHSNAIEVFPEVMQLMEMKVSRQQQHTSTNPSGYPVLHMHLGNLLFSSLSAVRGSEL